jgi:hypothetical protein
LRPMATRSTTKERKRTETYPLYTRPAWRRFAAAGTVRDGPRRSATGRLSGAIWQFYGPAITPYKGVWYVLGLPAQDQRPKSDVLPVA